MLPSIDSRLQLADSLHQWTGRARTGRSTGATRTQAGARASQGAETGLRLIKLKLRSIPSLSAIGRERGELLSSWLEAGTEPERRASRREGGRVVMLVLRLGGPAGIT